MAENRSKTSARRGIHKPLLSPKELKFLKEFVKTGNQSQSAIAAGYSPLNPDVTGSILMRRLREKVPEILERIGLKAEKVFKKVLVPGLNAHRTEFFAHGGVVIDAKNTVDHEQRGKYLDRYCKLLGLYPNSRQHDDARRSESNVSSGVTVELKITPDELKELMRAGFRIAVSDCGEPLLLTAGDSLVDDSSEAAPNGAI